MDNSTLHFLFVIVPFTIIIIGITFIIDLLIAQKWGNASRHYNNGIALIKQGKGETNEALEEFENAIEENPKLWQAYFNAARIYHNQGIYDTALEYIKKVIEIKPKFAMGYFHLGKILQAKGLETWNWDEAIKAYHKALELKLPRKEKIQCHLILAHTYSELGKFEKAEEELEITLRLDPKNSDAKKLKKELTNKGLITKTGEQEGLHLKL